MKKILMLGVVLFSVLMIGNASCFATPPLGVATDTGFYAYTDPDAPTDAWIQYFATNGIVPAVGELEGFILGPSGSNLTIFTNYNPATYSIYLIASTEGNHLPMTFGGTSLTYDTGNGFINGQADGYTATPYAYVELVDNGYSWEDAPDAFPAGGNGPYWFCTAPITYRDGVSEGLLWGYYFFAGAEINDIAGLQYSGSGMSHDNFSPKTTSAGGHTPEPAIMLLFGIGALGFGVAKRRKR